jgi:hypothetical protein
MKRIFLILISVILLSGCGGYRIVKTDKMPVEPEVATGKLFGSLITKDHTNIFAKSGLNIDADSNDAVDIAYGGTNEITAAAAADMFGAAMTATGAAAILDIADSVTAGDSYSNFSTSADDDTVDELMAAIDTALGIRCLESVFGTALEADDLELSGGTTLQLAAEIPHIDVAQTITGNWELPWLNLDERASAPFSSGDSTYDGYWWRADETTWNPGGTSLGYGYFGIHYWDDPDEKYIMNFDEHGTLHLANTPIVASANPTTDTTNKIALDYSDGGQDPIFIEVYDEGNLDASTVVASNVICESFTILEPDSAVSVEPNIMLKQFVAEGYPHGVTFVSIHVGTDGTDVTNDSINFERWTGEDDGSPDTMENIDMTGVDNNEDDGTIANSPAADDYLVADITGWNDDIPLLIITICYRINTGD